MYPVSNEFLNAIESNTRKYYYTGTITTVNNVVYEFDNENILKGSGYITRQCSGSTEIEIGTVYSAEMGITLILDIDRYTLFGAEIKLFFHLVLSDGTVETIPMGIFEISEANRHIKTLELKAYDYMLRFDKDLSLTSSSGSAYDFLNLACIECEVELWQSRDEISKLPNGNETLGIYADNDMDSFRDLIYYVAQLLGCVCQINRDGKLELIQFSTTPIVTIPTEQRFDSSYSDFVTHYTAVSSSNLMTEENEYYSLDVDDGLTLDLGTNPLLQFGLQATRERMLTNILNSISIINYTPFDSTVIGNPALDPMDVLTFSGGHADETQISCITSITYKIGGRQSLKCVGKNPLLANAKSKTDKELNNLSSQIESETITYYNFVNAESYSVSNSPTQIIAIDFIAKKETSAIFNTMILIETSGIKDTAEIIITYKISNVEIAEFYPTRTCTNSKDFLTLFLPLIDIEANTKEKLSVFIQITDGSVNIDVGQIKATISGQGLVASMSEWDGTIEISDDFTNILIPTTEFTIENFTDTLVISQQFGVSQAITQNISNILIETTDFNID